MRGFDALLFTNLQKLKWKQLRNIIEMCIVNDIGGWNELMD